MRKSFTFLVLVAALINIQNVQAETSSWPEHLNRYCQEEVPGSPVLYCQDFPWKQSLLELREFGRAIYNSEKRLAKRAFWDAKEEKFYLPYKPYKSATFKNIEVPKRFYISLRLQIENALKNGYANTINFSDMGHAHFVMLQERFDSIYSILPTASLLSTYLKDPQLKWVFHTAEQLKMTTNKPGEPVKLVEDPYLQWRYYSRNIMGSNQMTGQLEVLYAKGSEYNCIRSVEDHRWGWGFVISANKKGCFPFTFNRKIHYFDISLYPLDRDTNNIGDYGDCEFSLN